MVAVKGWGPRLLAHWWVALALLLPGVASAEQRTFSEIEKRQYLLIWAGQYNGLVDGVWGPNSNDALNRWYASRYGRVPSYLSASEREDLTQDAASAVDAAGFVIERDRSLGVTFGVPTALLAPWRQDDVAVRAFRSSDGRAQMKVEYLAGRYASLDQLFRIRSREVGRKVEYEHFAGNWFVLSGTDKDQAFYERYAGVGDDLRGFSVRYPSAEGGRYLAAVVAMSNLFRPSETASDPLLSFANGLREQLINVVKLWDECLRADDLGAKIRACTAIVSLKYPRGGSLHLAYYERASALARQLRWESAIRDYSEAIRLRPSYAEARYGRAEAYREAGSSYYDRALTEYYVALRLLPSSHPWRAFAEYRIAELKSPPPPVISAILYEEPPPGMEDDGSVAATAAEVDWSFDPNGPFGFEIVAKLSVPSRDLTVEMTIHRNPDSTLPASHLIEIRIRGARGPNGKEIESIPRIVLKPTESAKGQPLISAAAKVADRLFWIALSAADKEVASNLSLLRDRNWIDLPFVYENGQRAILSFKKGAVGTDAFEKAIALWETGDPPLTVAPASNDDFQIAIARKAIELRATSNAAVQKVSELRKRLGELQSELLATQDLLVDARAEALAKNQLAEDLKRAAIDAQAKAASASQKRRDAENKAANEQSSFEVARQSLADAEAVADQAEASRDGASPAVAAASDRAAEALAAAEYAEVIATTMRRAVEAIAPDEGGRPESKALAAAADRAERDAAASRATATAASETLEAAKTRSLTAEAAFDDAVRALETAKQRSSKAADLASAARETADEASRIWQAADTEASVAYAAAETAADDAENAEANLRNHISQQAKLADDIARAREAADEAEEAAQIAEAAALTAEALANLVAPGSDLTPAAEPEKPDATTFNGTGISVATSTRTIGGRDVAWVAVRGPIEPGDDASFNRALLTIDNPVVFVSLESPGGDVETGIKIGRTIWNNQYQTVVESGDCYSMCAYIWLAGRPRFMGSTAKIGFHAPWRGKDDKVEVSSVGSAIVGGYLADLGFTSAAMAYMTAPGPSDFQILTPVDAERLAIYAQPWR